MKDNLIKSATNPEDFNKCWEVIHELRPNLCKSDFIPQMLQMKEEGYELAFIERDSKAVSAVGFRYLNLLYSGKHYYMDDLSTLPTYRGQGYASILLDYVIELAKKKEYKCVMLDSGHQRFTAHRLYLNKGFNICSHHFCKSIQ